MTKNISLKKLRPMLPKVIEEIDTKIDRFVITRRGKPVALMISIEDYESLIETLNVLADRKLMKRIKQAEADMRKGKIATLESVEKELGIV